MRSTASNGNELRSTVPLAELESTRRPLSSTSALTALRPRSAMLAEPSLPRPAVSLAEALATGSSRSNSPTLVEPVLSISVRSRIVTGAGPVRSRSEEHTSELQSLKRISYAVFCLKTKNDHITHTDIQRQYTK